MTKAEPHWTKVKITTGNNGKIHSWEPRWSWNTRSGRIVSSRTRKWWGWWLEWAGKRGWRSTRNCRSSRSSRVWTTTSTTPRWRSSEWCWYWDCWTRSSWGWTSTGTSICSGTTHNRRYILLLSNLIPISIKINLVISRKFFNFKIEHDKDIPGSRNNRPWAANRRDHRQAQQSLRPTGQNRRDSLGQNGHTHFELDDSQEGRNLG